MDELKNGTKKNNNFANNNNNVSKESRTNTNRLKHLFVCPNNSGLINHLKKENERLRKLVVTYEFKTRKYNEDKLNIRNINKNYYIIENCLNFSLSNNDEDNNKEENSEIISLSNKYDRDLITDDLKYNKINSNINTGNNTNTNNNSKKNETKLITKPGKNIANSNKSNGYNKKIFNYTKINNNKNNIKKAGILGYDKDRKLATLKEVKNNIERERNNSLNQRQKNSNLNNYNNTVNNFNHNSKNKSKQLFNVKNNNITRFNKKYKEDLSSNSRNQSLGVKRRINNNSFNDTMREKKTERFPNIDRNSQRNNFGQCQSVVMNTFENDRIEKKLDKISLENDFNSSRSKSKQIKKRSNESEKDIYNKKVMLNKINNYNLAKNEFVVGYKKKNQNRSVNKRKTSNNNFMEKKPKKQINKHDHIFHSYNLVM